MTIEEAIDYLTPIMEGRDYHQEAKDAAALTMAIAALRAQQTPAKLDRSRWKACRRCCEEEVFVKRRQYMRPIMAPLTPEQELMDRLTELTGIVYVKAQNKFCPFCGRPLTEEAWTELEKKLEV